MSVILKPRTPTAIQSASERIQLTAEASVSTVETKLLDPTVGEKEHEIPAASISLTGKAKEHLSQQKPAYEEMKRATDTDGH